MKLWLNGALVDRDEARIAPNDRGLTLGDGLFETMRADGGRVIRLDRHKTRLARGCSVIGLAPPDWTEVEAAIAALLSANGLDAGEAALRLTYTRGPAPPGVIPPETPTPTLLITAGPAPTPRPPVALIVATVTRRNEHSPLSRCKTLNYLDNIIAQSEAASRGAGDAILLNTAGRVAETTVANIFLGLDGRLVTPPLREGCLDGTRRADILDAGLAEEAPVGLDDLARATEAFITNANGIRPVVSIDGRTLDIGPLSRKCAGT